MKPGETQEIDDVVRELGALINWLDNLRLEVEIVGIQGRDVRLTFKSDAAAQQFVEVFDRDLTKCVDYPSRGS